MFNNCWVAGGCQGLGYACYGGIPRTMTSYTNRCTSTRRICWCKFGRNPTKSFCVICILVILSLVPRQDFSLDFACLSIYIFDTSPELFVCLSIYQNAETLSPGRRLGYVMTHAMRSLSQSRPVININWPIVHSRFHDIKSYVFLTGYFCHGSKRLR